MKLGSSTWRMTALALACGASFPVGAQMVFTSRSSIARIDTSAADFSDATVTINATTQVGAGSSGSRTLDFSASPELVSHSSSSAGQVQLAETGFVPPSEIRARVDATGPGGGSFTFVEHFNGGTDPYGYGPLFVFPNGGGDILPFTNATIPVLEYYLPVFGAGLVDDGGSFSIGLSIAGDYSGTHGLDSAGGQHVLLNLDPAWQIVTDFVYDPVSRRTNFLAVDPSYRYDPGGDPSLDPNAQLDVYFFAPAAAVPAVPEPNAAGLLLAGLAALGFAAARRRRHAARPR